jgi:hypothetical protein
MDVVSQTPPAVPRENPAELEKYVEKQLNDHYEDLRNLTDSANGVVDEKVGVDSAATAGYLGALPSDGVFRVTGDLTYADGGDFITIGLNKTQDYTWTGGHQFDASLTVMGNAEFSDAVFDGSVDISGALDCSVLFCEQSLDASDAAFAGDVSIAGVLKVDGTATEFGGTAGIGLFYDPTVMAGASDTTGQVELGNGLRFAYGSVDAAPDTPVTVALDGWSAIYSATSTLLENNNTDRNANVKIGEISASAFTLINTNALGNFILSYIAIGR